MAVLFCSVEVAKPYYVYVLWSITRPCFYIGVTEDVNQRLVDHSTGVSQWTKNKGPWKLVWQSTCENLSEPTQLEQRLKRRKGGQRFYELTGLNIRMSSRDGSSSCWRAGSQVRILPALQREVLHVFLKRRLLFE